jgi:carbamoyltransferase
MRDLLIACGYTAGALRGLLNVRGLDDVGLLGRAAAIERIRDDRSAAAVLTRLFFLELEEPTSVARAAIGRESLDALRAAGWIRQRGRGVRPHLTARLRVDPVAERYFVSDLRFRKADPGAARWRRGDEVYPPSSDSILLGAVVRPRGRGRVLDLCTGSGVQALQQSAAADSVVAVDVNPRAVAAARCNAALNGVANVDVRRGDLYAAVRNERFDLIVANPPFVTSPHERAPSFHSGGATGDRVLRRVIRGWRYHLEKGGRAFAVAHVGVRSGDTIERVARDWFANFPGGALVLVCETGSPVDLAAAQSLFALGDGLDAYRREVERWHTHLRRHRISEVALVLIAACNSGRRKVEVVDARPRVLPLPLAPGPEERIAKWLAARRS